MRSASIAAAVAILAALDASAAPAAAPDTWRVIKSDAQYLTVVLSASMRRKGTGVTARIVQGTRYLDDYSIQTVEYDCNFLKMRILAFDRYKADGTLTQSYRNTDWMGAYDQATRTFLCTGQGGLGDIQSTSDHALGKAWLAGTLALP